MSICDGSYVALAKQLESILYTADETLAESLTPEDKKHVEHVAEYAPLPPTGSERS